MDKEQYWFGPDKKDRRIVYAAVLTPEILINGAETNRRINLCVDRYVAETGRPAPTLYASGWRPPSVNEVTSNAAANSNHLDAEAGDVRDDAVGSFAWWCYEHKDDVLADPEIDLYMEHPVATVVGHVTPWCHLQTVPPKSKARVYFPTTVAFQAWQKVGATFDSKKFA